HLHQGVVAHGTDGDHQALAEGAVADPVPLLKLEQRRSLAGRRGGETGGGAPPRLVGTGGGAAVGPWRGGLPPLLLAEGPAGEAAAAEARVLPPVVPRDAAVGLPLPVHVLRGDLLQESGGHVVGGAAVEHPLPGG